MNYREIKPVYTIVLYEESPGIFKKYPHKYIHNFRQTSDTGLEMELLERYTFVALDIFRNILQNRDIKNKREAWLAFLCMDDPEWIIKIIEKYPCFRSMYSEVYEMCRNLEEVMAMYSKELLELDEGTAQYMIDEMQEQLKETNDQLKKTGDQLKESNDQLEEKNNQLKRASDQLKEKDRQLKEKDSQMEVLNRRIQKLEALLNISEERV